MNVRSTLLLAGLAGAALMGASSAHAARYTCENSTPCIVATDELGKHRVLLKWSGQGTKYNFYKLTIRLHGGGPEKTLRLSGGRGGQIRIDLKKAGDYEIYLAGCNGQKKGGEPVCRPSSEHVRLNLR